MWSHGSTKNATTIGTHHDLLGHNGTMGLYNYIRQFYFWKGLKLDCINHVCKCKDCQQGSLKNQHYVDSNIRVPNVPMAYIAMDLLCEYSKMSWGQCHVLTIICMLTSFVEVILVEDKKTKTAIKAYLRYVYADKGGSKFVLTYRGSEFSCGAMSYIADQLGFTKGYTSPYSPKSNSVIERYHSFLKISIRKMRCNHDAEWDELIHIAKIA